MRLALIRQRYVAHEMERYTEAALEALLERNVAISLYTREWPQTRLQLIEPVICNPPYLEPLSRDWGFARAACRAVKAIRPELVESDEPIACCDLYRAVHGVHATRHAQQLRATASRARLGTALNPYESYLRNAERTLLTSPWIRAIICPSSMVRDDIHARFGVGLERLHVVPPSVDSDAFHPGLRSLRQWLRERHQIPESAVVYLTVARDYAHDGVAVAIAALARLPETSHLLIVGAEPHLRDYIRVAEALEVRPRVTFAGPQAEPKPYFGAADAFVLPTLYDPCSRTTLEAMACGLPVITSTHSGVAELVSEHDAGFACDALDVAALADHMRALHDKPLARTLGDHARLAVAGLNTASLTLQLVLVYRALLMKGSDPGLPRDASMQTDVLLTDRADEPRTTPLLPAELAVPPALADAASELPHDPGNPVPVLDQALAADELPPEIGVVPDTPVVAQPPSLGGR
ncbi:MAG: glycosyltransferase family 4 protein [Pseudomonadota bacterium]|nr:glycosyltransferase family 4 protein [Pseudomonadota bacterium]